MIKKKKQIYINFFHVLKCDLFMKMVVQKKIKKQWKVFCEKSNFSRNAIILSYFTKSDEIVH